MRQRIKTIAGLLLLSLFILFSCSGCGSSSNSSDAKMKLVSAEGAVNGYSTNSSYTYDAQGHLTNLVTQVIYPDIDNGPMGSVMESSGAKAAMEQSTALVSDYRVTYDDSGNLDQLQMWMQFLDGEEIIYSMLVSKIEYTYNENKLTQCLLYQNDGPGGMVAYEKKSYNYDDAGDMVAMEVYEYDYGNDAFYEDPYKVISLKYDVEKNVSQAEKKYMNSDNPYGYTYVMTYNSDRGLLR